MMTNLMMYDYLLFIVIQNYIGILDGIPKTYA